MTGRTVRIALSVTSGASLGAYEAGAVAGLVVALQRLNERSHRRGEPPPVVLDAVGATSAGAMVGLLASRCLLGGLDPLPVLHEAWVRQASLRRLAHGRRDAPLSMVAVQRDTVGLLEPRDRRGRPVHRTPAAARQARPIEYSVALGSLQGLTYRIDGTGADPALAGLTHVDRATFTLRRDDGRDRYVRPRNSSPLDAAIASMSHPAAFGPRVLDRRADEEAYLRAGVSDFPASGHFWCTDGSALLTRPLGGTLDAARRADRAATDAGDGAGDRPGHGSDESAGRMHLLVHPHTAGPGASRRWTDPDGAPPWTSTLARLLTTLTTEPLYADLRAIEDVNARLRWSRELAEVLAPHLSAASSDALREVLGRMTAEQAGPGASGDGLPTDSGGGPGTEDLGDLLLRVLRTAGGVAGKFPVGTEVISPLQLVEQPADAGGSPRGQQQVPSLLAGEFMGRFGGFTARALRQSDFALGWQSLSAWLPDAFARAGVPDEDIAGAVDAVTERDVRHDGAGRRGGAGLGDAPLAARLRLVGLIGRAARGAASDVLRGRRHSG
ncbi:patatin-like phospholipase domain-containing protein [Blastococcus goldschmidtiae]|uniref:PNPLA domain-containing protein n=1 Tax=Blastococcus goldschmidtiae TaxID=3075546 RepID=A0ABU2KA92_9ACTN|nr:hypothetical protein [Blastococcus sp. DSM 46792]MDT0277097.1 hypothetical protein [Blastococcus sp. DSM 46792]